MRDRIRKIRPAVDKKILVLMAGIIWCGVGVMLLSYSVSWLISFPEKNQLIFGSAGFLVAMPIHHFGFLRLADKNLARLLPMTDKKCFFSFMTWKSYLIVPIMVSMGIFLRNSLIPKEYLLVIYTGIGLGLFLSGIRYFRFFVNLLLFKKAESPVQK